MGMAYSPSTADMYQKLIKGKGLGITPIPNAPPGVARPTPIPNYAPGTAKMENLGSSTTPSSGTAVPNTYPGASTTSYATAPTSPTGPSTAPPGIDAYTALRKNENAPTDRAYAGLGVNAQFSDFMRYKYMRDKVPPANAMEAAQRNAEDIVGAQSIAGGRRELSAYDSAMSPIRPSLSPDQNASNARDFDQNAAAQISSMRDKTQPGTPEYDNYTRSLMNYNSRLNGSPAAQVGGFIAGGMSPAVGAAAGEAEANSNYARGGTATTAGQDRGATAQYAQRNAAAEYYNVLKRSREMGSATRVAGAQQGLYGAQAGAEQARGTLETAKYANTPEAVASMYQANLNRLKTGEAQSKGTLATSQGGATSEAMQAERDMLAKAGGITDATDTNVEENFKKITPLMSDLTTGKVAGGYWGGAEGAASSLENFNKSIVGNLEKYQAQAPNAVREKALAYLAAMDKYAPVGESGKYESGKWGGSLLSPFDISGVTATAPVNVRNRARVAVALNQARARLQKLAGVGG